MPESLAVEGRRMLQALLDEFKLIRQIEILLLLDRRVSDLNLPDRCQIIWIDHSDFWVILNEQIQNCDAVLPIAPEQDGLLGNIAAHVQASHKQLWLSSPDTVQLCTDKMRTIQVLARHGLPVVETHYYADDSFSGKGAKVIKPNDGLGCQGSLWVEDISSLKLKYTDNLIVQPYIEGEALSLSTVCAEGRGYLLTCNRQHILIEDSRFKLTACSVNIQHPRHAEFQSIVWKIAEVMPGLWGYVGIDLIISPDFGPLILEINPRLTTSYVGLYQATGVALHEQLFNLLNGHDFDFSTKWQTNVHVSL